MSDEQALQTAGSGPESAPRSATPGEMLRAAREAAGLHVAALAVAMKVPVKKLEALEADRFDLLPDAVFVRALASSVCRSLKIDPAPILSLLPHQDAPRLSTHDQGINAPFHAAGETRGLSLPAVFKQPVFLFVVLLLVAALVVLVFPGEAEKPAADETASQEAEIVSPVQPGQIIESVASPAPVGPEVTPPAAATPAPVAAAASSAPVAATPTAAASAALAPVTDAKSATATAGAQQVSFRVKGSSWVEVTDAKGTVLMRRNLSEGEAVGTSGVLPLSVVVGRADVTEVEVKGKSFNLAAIAKDNVARFEVK